MAINILFLSNFFMCASVICVVNNLPIYWVLISQAISIALNIWSSFQYNKLITTIDNVVMAVDSFFRSEDVNDEQ